MEGRRESIEYELIVVIVWILSVLRIRRYGVFLSFNIWDFFLDFFLESNI